MDFTSDDLKLEPLADNGGPTHTHALGEGSIAIDAAISEYAPETDQRGMTRSSYDEGHDIGAFEYVPATASGDGCSISAGLPISGSLIILPLLWLMKK